MTIDEYLKEVKNFIHSVKKPDVIIRSIRYSKRLNEDNTYDMDVLVFFKNGNIESNFTANLYNTFSKPEPLKILNSQILIELDRCALLHDLSVESENLTV